MKKLLIAIYFLSVCFLPTACDFLNPTEVINPNLTDQSVIGTVGSAERWVIGLQRQNALVYNGIVDIAELGSDNYVNTETFFNQQFDGLTISYQDPDVNTAQFTIADLRQSAAFGIEEVFPADASAEVTDQAEMYFYRGWAKLLSGELFRRLPLEPDGPAVPSVDHLQSAITDFQQADQLVPGNASYQLALARVYYDLGNAAEASQHAQAAINIDPEFLRSVEYDALNAPTSDMQDALFDRGSFDDLQPLPRLDFLDPKYYGRSASEESPIYFQKIEEAHLIIAEAQLAAGQLAEAQATMKNIVALVQTRPLESFSDAAEDRTDDNPSSRPDSTIVEVRASPQDPFRAGLVLNRQGGEVSVPVVSGTSVTAAYIDTQNTLEGLLETLYLMRQEIFIAEGRRFIDLGIKMPVSETELLANSDIQQGEDIQALIPTFLPTDMDAIEFTPGSTQATIKYNLNRILVENRASAEVVPFF